MHCLLVAASLSFTIATNHMILPMSEEVFQKESYTIECKVNVITVSQLKELQLYMCTTAKNNVNTHHETCFKCIMCYYHLNISFEFLYHQNITFKSFHIPTVTNCARICWLMTRGVSGWDPTEERERQKRWHNRQGPATGASGSLKHARVEQSMIW